MPSFLEDVLGFVQEGFQQRAESARRMSELSSRALSARATDEELGTLMDEIINISPGPVGGIRKLKKPLADAIKSQHRAYMNYMRNLNPTLKKHPQSYGMIREPVISPSGEVLRTAEWVPRMSGPYNREIVPGTRIQRGGTESALRRSGELMMRDLEDWARTNPSYFPEVFRDPTQGALGIVPGPRAVEHRQQLVEFFIRSGGIPGLRDKLKIAGLPEGEVNRIIMEILNFAR